MTKKELLKKIAALETREDFLITELEHLDKLFKKIGFENGIITLKLAAQALASSCTE